MDNVEKMVEGELTATQKLEQFEKEKLTRRQALAKFGFQAGAAAVAALTADELLRKVGKEMQRRAGDNKVAQQVAKELNGAGVAFADVVPPTCCDKSWEAYNKAVNACNAAYAICIQSNTPLVTCITDKLGCIGIAESEYAHCKSLCSNAGLGCNSNPPPSP